MRLSPRLVRLLPAGGTVVDDAGVALRVVSLNLLHGLDMATGQVDTARVAAAVARLEPDVVALQEVDRGQPRSGEADQVGEVAAAVGGHARFAAALAGDPARSWEPAFGGDVDGPAYGVGLVSRWPICRAQPVALPGGGAGTRSALPSPLGPGYDREPRAALRAELDVDGHRLPVTATHLSYLPWRGARQLRVAAAAAADSPAVLVGDLNLPVFAVRGLARGWRHAGGAATHPAWSPRTQPDQLLVRGRLAIDEVRVGPRFPGDHLPLSVRLRLW